MEDGTFVLFRRARLVWARDTWSEPLDTVQTLRSPRWGGAISPSRSRPQPCAGSHRHPGTDGAIIRAV